MTPPGSVDTSVAGRAVVVGFEGVLSPQRVPARLAAIVVDADGHRLVVRDGKFRRLSNAPLHDLPSTATPVERLDAVPGYDFLVLAASDVEQWRRAASEGRLFAPEGFGAQMRQLAHGAYVAWLSRLDDAKRVLALLCDATISDLRRVAAAPQNHDTRLRLYDLAWRLVQCAISDDDVFLAAVVLHRSLHPERGDYLLSGYFPMMSPTERENKLATARLRLDEPETTHLDAHEMPSEPSVAGDEVPSYVFQVRDPKTVLVFAEESERTLDAASGERFAFGDERPTALRPRPFRMQRLLPGRPVITRQFGPKAHHVG